MIKLITITLCISLLTSCTTNKKINATNEMSSEITLPGCLQTIINNMIAEPNGSPQSVTKYTYKHQTVYYLVSPCCDKYNIVYDSTCNILGYPDGGFTGKGDGKMMDFADEATDKEIAWEKE